MTTSNSVAVSPGVSRRPTGVAATISDVTVMTRRALTLMMRSPMTLSTASFMPIILLLLMSVSFGKMIMPTASLGEYVQYAAPVFTVMGVIFGTVSTAMATFGDRTSGFDDRIRVSPVSPVAPLAGRIAADAVRNLITVSLVTIVAVAMGLRFENGVTGFVAYFAIALVFGFGVAWLMVAIAMYADSAETTGAFIQALMLLMTFFSTGFLKADDLPGWAQPIAQANPISHVAAAMRGAVGGPNEPANWGSEVMITLAWSVGLTVVFGFLAVRGYRRAR